MAKVIVAGSFDRDYQDLQKENPDIKGVVDRKVTWFKKNPEDTRLDNHTLTGKMLGRWSFSITDDIRIVYRWTNKTTARFLAIGPHHKVYLKK